MNVAIFGGTFDPIHRGHVAVARAARDHYQLKEVLFVPTWVPPHKRSKDLTPFHHRYAMTALAVQGEKGLVPSLLEDPEAITAEGDSASDISYSVETVKRLKRKLKRSDRLFFIIGIDAFLDIAKWRSPEELMHEAEFIIASRPGYSLADIAQALPESIRPKETVTKPFKKSEASGDIILGGVVLHLLPHVSERVSATQIRAAAKSGKKLDSLVGPAVADYIRKTHLYHAKNAPETASATDIKASSGAQKATAKAKILEINKSRVHPRSR